MGFFKTLRRRSERQLHLATSTDISEYAQIDCCAALSSCARATVRGGDALEPRPAAQLRRHTGSSSSKGWLARAGDLFQTTPTAAPFVEEYAARLDRGRQRAMEKVRTAIVARDCGEALDIRRQYESSHPLGSADWSGPEPQLSRRLANAAASSSWTEWLPGRSESRRWSGSSFTQPSSICGRRTGGAGCRDPGITWRPDLASPALTRRLRPHVGERTNWRFTWTTRRRGNATKGGDHVRHVSTGPEDGYTCEFCRAEHGQEYLVGACA
ncbi:MAG: hypothetical protein R2854_17840 [Caldilineaceae bacterium]